MKVRFYGVRGSIPAPVSSKQIQSKITAVIQRISAKDIVSTDADSGGSRVIARVIARVVTRVVACSWICLR